MNKSVLYKISFYNQGNVYEIYAKSVSQAGLYGFIEAEELQLNTASAVVVDPSEERLKTEFDGVQKTFIPMHNIIRIDQVDKKGIAKIHEPNVESNVKPFPAPVYTPIKPGES